ncbi:MAG: hypothetical protein R2707_07405 [Acidimicrobiales bacterium]
MTTAELQHLARGQAPFVSIYVDTRTAHRDTLVQRVAAVADGLCVLGAPDDIVRRTTTAFLAPPADRAGLAVVASSDGRTVVASSPEPFERDVGLYSRVPYLGPMIEIAQQSITHAVVRDTEHGVPDLTVFGADGSVQTTTAAAPQRTDDVLAEVVRHDPAVVFVVGDAPTSMVTHLERMVAENRLRPDCRIEPLDEGTDDDVADAVVRHAAGVVASHKVELLREFRFERSHGRAVDGIDAVVAAVNAGLVATLILNADPDDHRRAIVGSEGDIVPLDGPVASPSPAVDEVPLVDALIWATLARGGAGAVIPTTGDGGPADDIGALLIPRPANGLIDR